MHRVIEMLIKKIVTTAIRNFYITIRGWLYQICEINK